MLRNFMKNVSFMLALNLMIKPLWVLSEIWVQNRVGDTQYGLYSATLSLCIILGISLDLGINQMITREVARDNTAAKSLFAEAMGVKILLIPVFIILVFGTALLLEYNVEQIHMLAILALAQIFTSLLLFIRAGFQGLHYFKQDSILSITDRLVLIIGLVFLLVLTTFNIFYLAYSQLIAYSITFLIAGLWLQKKSGYVNIHIKQESIKNILKKIAPYAVLWFFMAIYTRIDSVMLEWLLRDTRGKDFGKYMAGVYASAYRLMDFSNTIPIMFATIMFPVFSSLLDKKRALELFVKNVLAVMLFITFVIVSITTFYAKDILMLLYKNKNAASVELASPVFVVLMWAYICFVLIYVFGTLLTSAEQLKKLSQITVIGAILSIIVNALLIPRYHALGAAIALLCTQVLMVVLHLILCQKQFYFKYKLKYLAKIFIFAGASFAVSYSSTFLPVFWVISAMVATVLNITVAFAIKLVSKEVFLSLLKKNK